MNMNVDPAVVENRFLSNTKRDISGCLNWSKSLTNGYGRFGVNGKRLLAHRFSFMWFKGSIFEGMVINHRCRNRRCVNPDHLEQVTASQNNKFHYNGDGYGY